MSKTLKDPDFLDRLKRVEAKQRDMENGTTAIRPNARFLPTVTEPPPPVEVTRWYLDVGIVIGFEAIESGLTDWSFSDLAFIDSHDITEEMTVNGDYNVSATIELFKRKVTVIAPSVEFTAETPETEPPVDWDAYLTATDDADKLELAKWRLDRGSKVGDFSEVYTIGMKDNAQGIDAAPGFEAASNYLDMAAHDPFVVEDFIYGNEPDADATAHSFNDDVAGVKTWHMDLDYAAGVTETPNYIELIPTGDYGSDIGGPGLTTLTGIQWDLLTDFGYNTGGHPFYGGYHWVLPMPTSGDADGEWVAQSQVVLAPGVIEGATLADWTRVGTVGLFQFNFHVRRVTTLE